MTVIVKPAPAPVVDPAAAARAKNQAALDAVFGKGFVSAGEGRGNAALTNFATPQQIQQYTALRQAYEPGFTSVPGAPVATGNAQLDEALRQSRLEMQRIQAQYNASTGISGDQLTAAQLQAAAQQTQGQAWQNIYNQQLLDQENQRKQAEQSALTAAQNEAAQRQAEAAATAANQSAYTTGRTQRTDQITNNITDAYSGFDDNYYNKFAKDFIDYYNPQVADQAKAASKQLTFKYANQGGINSSAYAGQLSDLQKAVLAKQKDISGQAANAASSFRSDIDTQRKDLLGEALSANNIGPEVLPSGVDAGTSLERITAALTPYANLAKQKAASITTPSYSSLGQLFSDYTSNGGANSGSTATTFNNSNLYQPKTTGASRVVM